MKLRVAKLIYHRLFVASGINYLISNFLCLISRAHHVVRCKDIQITDVMALGLSCLVKDRGFGLSSDPNTITRMYREMVKISRTNYISRSDSSCRYRKTVVLSFQGPATRKSSISSYEQRSKFYAELILLISAQVEGITFLILEHKEIRGFLDTVIANLSSLLKRKDDSSQLPFVEVLVTKNLLAIQELARCSSYYLGNYGTDPSIFLLEGTPGTIVCCDSWWATRHAFLETGLDPDLVSYAQFFTVSSAISLELSSAGNSESQSEFSLMISSIIKHMKDYMF